MKNQIYLVDKGIILLKNLGKNIYVYMENGHLPIEEIKLNWFISLNLYVM